MTSNISTNEPAAETDATAAVTPKSSPETVSAARAPSAAVSVADAGNRTTAGSHREALPGSTSGAIDLFHVDCLMNARYHSAREGFLNSAHRWLMFGIIILGTGAVIDATNEYIPVKGILGAIAAVFGAIDLVFDLSNRACAHSLMKRRYFELLSRLQEKKLSVDEAHAEMSKFSADEEPAFHALLLLSWNAAEEMVFGEKALRYNIGLWARITKNILRFEGKKVALAKQST